MVQKLFLDKLHQVLYNVNIMSILLSILLNVAALPAHTQERLERVPAADRAIIQVDKRGDLFYKDEGVFIGEVLQYPYPGDSRKLHSNPDASQKLFLNFDGYDYSDTVVADYDPNPPTIALPANLNNDTMYLIWWHVAEDYSPFDVDVTTEKPTGSYGEIVFTFDTDSNGDCLYECGWGGLAWLDHWSITPALVFVNNVYGTVNKAEAASHEAGHLLSLHHDGYKIKNNTFEYFRGYSNWAPIMGVSYNKYMTQWNNGTYRYATNLEDDVEIIRSQLGTTTVPATISYPEDVDFYSYNFQTTTELSAAPIGINGYNLDVAIYYKNFVYDLKDISSRVIIPAGYHQFGISAGKGLHPWYGGAYGNLGRYTVTMTDFIQRSPVITICSNIASSSFAGDWYAETDFIGYGSEIELPKGTYTLLFDSEHGQELVSVNIKPGKTSKECR